jgi:hypothetical protein
MKAHELTLLYHLYARRNTSSKQVSCCTYTPTIVSKPTAKKEDVKVHKHSTYNQVKFKICKL